MRLLGIDYGEKRVGLALSDDTKTIATPLGVIQNDQALPGVIAGAVKEHHVEAVVIGASRGYRGEDNPIMERIRSFTKEMETKLHLPVYLESETLTSKQAARHEIKRSLRDASAAALILQSYLDKRKTKDV